MSANKSILIASHPRSGTHLLIDVIRRNFPDTKSWRWWGQPLDYLYLNIERSTSRQRYFNERLRAKILRRAKVPILKTHYLADFSESWIEAETAALPTDVERLLEHTKVLYIYRDPREVMTSYKQFLSPLRPDLEELTLGEFMRTSHWSGGDTLSWWRRHVEGWLDAPKVCSVAYSELISTPLQVMRKISSFIDVDLITVEPVLPSKVTSITKTRLDRVFSLSPGSTGIVADRARFPAKPWREAMTVEDHKWMESRVGDIMNRLGIQRWKNLT